MLRSRWPRDRRQLLSYPPAVSARPALGPRPPAHRGLLPAAVRARPAARLRCCRLRSHARRRARSCGRGGPAPDLFKGGACPERQELVVPPMVAGRSPDPPNGRAPAWLAFFREITLMKVHCDLQVPASSGVCSEGPGAARDLRARWNSRGAAGESPAQVRGRGEWWMSEVEIRSMPGCQGEAEVRCWRVGVRWQGSGRRWRSKLGWRGRRGQFCRQSVIPAECSPVPTQAISWNMSEVPRAVWEASPIWMKSLVKSRQ